MYAGLAVIVLLPRLPALAGFVTVDEPDWLSMGANFYYALGQREFQNTVYEYQPAVTTMWIITAAMLAYFPEYRGLGQGYLDFEKGLLDPFLLEHARDPLVLLQQARLIQVLLITALMLVALYLLQRLIGKGAAFLALAFASLDPFLLGQSRLLDHEAMLSLFGLISVLALLVYLIQGRPVIFLIVSAGAAALAQLTKSSGMALLAPIGLVLLLQALQDRPAAGTRAAILGALKSFGVWAAVLVVVYVVLWPGMWVAPGRMLYEVYGNAFSYAFQGARLIALEEAPRAAPGLDTDVGSLGQIVSSIVWRTTPLTWLGLLLGLLLTFTRDRGLVPPSTRLVGILMLVLAAAYIALFSLAKGRNSPHYTMSSYVAIDVFAGIGWYLAAGWLMRRTTAFRSRLALGGAFSVILALQAGSALAYYPYYFTYENPILAKLAPQPGPLFPYGEGLELSAEYLADLPSAENLTALAYYSRGCFSYFFPGQSEQFKPFYPEPGHEQDLRYALDTADYLVIYYALQGKHEKYRDLIDALAVVKPEKEIWLNGYRYVIIYRIDSIPPDVYAALTE